jgi:hypothetical protein
VVLLEVALLELLPPLLQRNELRVGTIGIQIGGRLFKLMGSFLDQPLGNFTTLHQPLLVGNEPFLVQLFALFQPSQVVVSDSWQRAPTSEHGAVSMVGSCPCCMWVEIVTLAVKRSVNTRPNSRHKPRLHRFNLLLEIGHLHPDLGLEGINVGLVFLEASQLAIETLGGLLRL